MKNYHFLNWLPFLLGSQLLTFNCFGQQYLGIGFITKPNLQYVHGVDVYFRKILRTNWYYGISAKYVVNRVIPYQKDSGQSIAVSLNQGVVSGSLGYIFRKHKIEPYAEVEAGGTLNTFNYYPTIKFIDRNIGALVNPKVGVQCFYKSVGLYLQASYYIQSVNRVSINNRDFGFSNSDFLLNAGFIFKLKP